MNGLIRPCSKDELIRQIDAERQLPGNSFGFSQPIQMRFNELIAGVRDDIAIKIFGDEFEPMLGIANQTAAILRRLDGAADVKVEEVVGLPFLDIRIDKSEIARRGLSLAAVQEVIGTAIGGHDAGLVFEGDRRFQIIVRLSDRMRETLRRSRTSPVSSGRTLEVQPFRCGKWLPFDLSEGPNQISRENGKRRVVVTANVRGRDIGSLVAEAQSPRSTEQIQLAARLLDRMGRPIREPGGGAPTADDRCARLLRPDLSFAV